MTYFQRFIEWLNLNTRSEAELEIKGLRDVFSLHKKEHAIFKQSRLYLLRNHSKLMQGYEYDCYNFQILCELLTRYKTEIGITGEQTGHIVGSLDGISFVNRFLMIGHYNAVGKYLRNIFEHATTFSFKQLGGTGRAGMKKKLAYIQKHSRAQQGEHIYQPSQDSKAFVSEIYKIYDHLCDYVHHISRVESIDFDEKQFNKMMHLSSITLRIAGKVYTMGIGDHIQKYWHNEIYKVVDLNRNYKAYILYLTNDGSLLIDLRRYMLDTYGLEKLKIDVKKLFPPSYFD